MVQGGRSLEWTKDFVENRGGRKIISVAMKQGWNKVGGIQHYISEMFYIII